MRRFLPTGSLFSLVLLLSLAAGETPGHAEDRPPDVKGLFLMTDYPAVTAQPGTTSNVSLRLQNYGLAPERLALKVEGVPEGWSATLLGGGQPVAAAMPGTNSSVSLQLRLDIPKSASMEAQTITVSAAGAGQTVSLPIVVSLAKELPAKLSIEPKLPALRGSAKSTFEYQLTIKNDSGRNILVSFGADAPKNFETSFTEQYGSQELSSIPIETGQSKDVKLKVRPPSTIGAGTYPVSVTASAEDAKATTKVSLEIVGQPKLRIAGREGLMSARAEAGEQASVPVFVMNEGSAPADGVELSGTGPSGWKIEFQPKTIDHIAPNERIEAQALITPSAKSLAGDYMASLKASAQGEQATGDFRITVSTSTMWGIAGVGILGVALLIMVGAVARFGRR
ncbi:MAG TPA: NEW3 domain-containing protein [Xanthobacteraceae bacterium]|nr:NEW3 domain-containing protein [Xanthobacteraceae bacterium]